MRGRRERVVVTFRVRLFYLFIFYFNLGPHVDFGRHLNLKKK